MRQLDASEWLAIQTDVPILSVNDLKQFLYCPRIVYYHWVIPVRPPTTFLMRVVIARKSDSSI